MHYLAALGSRSTWKMGAVAGLIVLVVAAATLAASSVTSSAKHQVRVIVDYNDGVQKHFIAIPWAKDMTVLDAMKHARSLPHGITFEYKGSGETALLLTIDDLKSRGRGSDGKSWLYWVNTDFGDKSFGIQQLNPSDVVLWRYDTYKDNK